MAGADHIIRSRFAVRFKTASSNWKFGANSGDIVAAHAGVQLIGSPDGYLRHSLEDRADKILLRPAPVATPADQALSALETCRSSLDLGATCGRQKEWRNTTTETARQVSISLLALLSTATFWAGFD